MIFFVLPLVGVITNKELLCDTDQVGDNTNLKQRKLVLLKDLGFIVSTFTTYYL